MVQPQNDIIARLGIVIGDWKSEVTGAHQGLTQQITQTNTQLSKLLQVLETRNEHITALSAAKNEIELLRKSAADGDLPAGAITQYSATVVASDDALQKQLHILERLAATVSLWKQEVTQSHAELTQQLQMSNSQFAQMLTLISPDTPLPVNTEHSEDKSLVREQDETIRNLREAKVELLKQVKDLTGTLTDLHAEYEALSAAQTTSEDDPTAVQQASEELEEARQQTSALQEERTALEAKLDQLKNNAPTPADLQALAFQRDTLQKTFTNLESQLNTLQKQDRQRTESAQTLLEELQAAQQTEEDQSTDLQHAQDETNSLREQLSQRETDLDTQQQENTQLQQNIAELQQQLEQARAEVPDDETKQANGEEEDLEQAERLKAEIDRLKDAEDHRAHALAEARSEAEARRQNLVERENEIAQLNDRMEETANTIQQLRQQVQSEILARQEAQERASESKREIDAARADLQAKDELLAESACTVEGYQGRAKQQEDALEMLKTQRESLATEVAHLQQRTAQVTAEQQDLSTEVISLRDETDAKQESLSEARSTADAQQLALAEREQNIATLGEQVQTLEKQLAELQQRERDSTTAAAELRDALEAMRTTEEPRAQALQESRETIREMRTELSERINAVDTLTTRCKELEEKLGETRDLPSDATHDSASHDDTPTAAHDKDATATALADARIALAEQRSKLDDGDDTIVALQEAFEALDGQLSHAKSESATHRQGMRHALAEMHQVIQERDQALDRLDALNDNAAQQSSSNDEDTQSASLPAPLQDDRQRIILSEFSKIGDQRPLGEILLSANVISQDQLQQALKEQRAVPSQLLGAVLANMNFASHECIAQAIACQLDLPLIVPSKNIVDEDAKKLLDKDLCTWHVFIPLRIIENKLLVAMANPLDTEAINLIKDLTHLDVSPVIATATDILVAINSVYSVS